MACGVSHFKALLGADDDEGNKMLLISPCHLFAPSLVFTLRTAFFRIDFLSQQLRSQLVFQMATFLQTNSIFIFTDLSMFALLLP
jgi:hypothetical protein